MFLRTTRRFPHPGWNQVPIYWLCSSLRDGSFDTCSSRAHYGSPQGSILGPLLVNFCTSSGITASETGPSDGGPGLGGPGLGGPGGTMRSSSVWSFTLKKFKPDDTVCHKAAVGGGAGGGAELHPLHAAVYCHQSHTLTKWTLCNEAVSVKYSSFVYTETIFIKNISIYY